MSLPCSNVVTASQDHLSQSLRNTYWGDYDPRIGIAFRPFRDNKTVFRAGFGIFTQTPLGQLAYDFLGIPLGAPYTYSNNNGGVPLFTFPQTSPASTTAQYGGTGFYDGMSPNYQGSSDRAMERNHRTPVDIRAGGANHLFRNEFLPDEREGGLQRHSSEQAALRTQSLRRSTRSLSELGRDQLQRQRGFFRTTRGSRWKRPKGCLTDCTFRPTTPGRITSATLKATRLAALLRKTSCLRLPTINSTCARLAEMLPACRGNGSC